MDPSNRIGGISNPDVNDTDQRYSRGQSSIEIPGEIRIGISGWRYRGWRGTFYPKGLVQRKELEFASRQFDTIELNGSFYSLQRPESFERWYEETPENFVFSIKGSRYISHMRRLQEIRTP